MAVLLTTLAGLDSAAPAQSEISALVSEAGNQR